MPPLEPPREPALELLLEFLEELLPALRPEELLDAEALLEPEALLEEAPLEEDDLDELPDLKTYPISGDSRPAETSPAPVTSAAASSVTAKTMKGDVNLDGKVDISDAVLIMQALANPSKYGEKGSDKSRLTAEGKANADVVGNDGITNMDALEIQRYTLRLIKAFE